MTQDDDLEAVTITCTLNFETVNANYVNQNLTCVCCSVERRKSTKWAI